ncbi:MAG: PIG-L family deacetylase [Spirochaetota bacterium]
MKKTIAAIMAHADDIEISAGGTFAKYLTEGYKGLYGVLSRCNSGWTVSEETGGHYTSSLAIIPRRRAEAEAAAKIFGAELYYGDLLENCHTLKDGTRIIPSYLGSQDLEGERIQTDEIPEGNLFATVAGAGDIWDSHPVIRTLTELLIEWEPELVIGQAIGNFNPDHFCAAQIIAIAWQLAAKKVDLGSYWIPAMYSAQPEYLFPPLKPDHFVDVTGYEDICLKAMACHRSQGQHLARAQQRKRESWKAWGPETEGDSCEAFLKIYKKET